MAETVIDQIKEILDFAKSESFAGYFAEAEALFAKAASLLKGAAASGKILFELRSLCLEGDSTRLNKCFNCLVSRINIRRRIEHLLCFGFLILFNV